MSLVDRDFARAEPSRLWVCDLKYIQRGQGFLFLAAVQDVFSRRIIGWSMRDDLKADVVLDALSDHGSQCTSLVYGAYAKQSGIDLSMGSIDDHFWADIGVAGLLVAVTAPAMTALQRLRLAPDGRTAVRRFQPPGLRAMTLGAVD